MERTRVLIASRDPGLWHALRLTVSALGWIPVQCNTAAGVGPDETARAGAIVLASAALADSWEDVAAAAELRAIHRDLPLMLVVTELSVDLALAALRAGVSDLRLHPGGT